jgi:hypothetical protein
MNQIQWVFWPNVSLLKLSFTNVKVNQRFFQKCWVEGKNEVQ